MCDFKDLELKIKQMIDRLKAISANKGLANTADEERIITTVFLYKFLNDQFVYNLKNFSEEVGLTVEEIWNDQTILDAFYDTYASSVAFNKEDTIEFLINKSNSPEFYKLFDTALENLSNNERNNQFKIENVDGSKEGLFKAITSAVDSNDKNSFAREIFTVLANESFNFENAFNEKFDFFASIFEYLIKDYNKDSGKYAEYFTPQVCARIMAAILTHGDDNKGAEIYDPSAGSGTLIMQLSHTLGQEDGINKALIYTQDISQKSSRFLRINLILNGLTESLHNIRKGDTLVNPAHYQVETNPSSGLKRFDYIVSNPPFKMDFTDTRELIIQKNKDTDRFFAGVPSIPPKKKESMAIYLLFIQHIMFSLKDNGKAAFVVPTGFITAQAGIEKSIRQKLIDNKWLIGCINMPSNIFANTGTNVSIIFIDKGNTNDKIVLMDASKMGAKEKTDGKNQKTVLSREEENKIINSFINMSVEDDFVVTPTFDDIKNKNYSFSAGQYFDIKIEYIELTQDEFKNKINNYKTNLKSMFDESKKLEDEIGKQLEGLKYE